MVLANYGSARLSAATKTLERQVLIETPLCIIGFDILAMLLNLSRLLEEKRGA